MFGHFSCDYDQKRGKLHNAAAKLCISTPISLSSFFGKEKEGRERNKRQKSQREKERETRVIN